MEKDKKDKCLGDKLTEFLDSQEFSINTFSRICGVSYNTLYKITKYGHKPLSRIARRIIKHSKGTFTLKDFGIEN